MLDRQLFSANKGGDPELIRDSQKRRGDSIEIVDEISRLDAKSTQLKYLWDQTNSETNKLQKEIGKRIKAKENADDLIKKRVELVQSAKTQEEQLRILEFELMSKIISVGNIVHPSVPVSMTEDDNVVLKFWNPLAPESVEETESCDAKLDEYMAKMNIKETKSHHHVLSALGGYDPERGVKICGHRGYFLREYGVLLNQAIINYSIQFLRQRDYTLLQAPPMINKEIMAKTAQLEQFDEELYKVIDGDEEKYLIATSEQPISAYHSGEWFDNPAKQLPIRYAGLSSCFRREAGSHGRDAWGIFRVHHFEKIEQFVLCEPQKSWDMLEQMLQTAEEFYQSLELPYRVISIVSGALNKAASKKYDLEAWFPFQKEYKELVSASNCTDYQSRRLEIRCGVKKMGDRQKSYVHCLNATLCATERTLCCILENYQTDTGVRVPKVLQPFMNNLEFLPYPTSEKAKDDTNLN